MIQKVKCYFSQLDFVTACRLSLSNIIRGFLNGNVQNSYSESGEDIIIEKLLGKKDVGFYIEVGSNHPIRYSNTFRYYCNGWRGVCVEPNSELNALHRKIRPKDIIISKAVSDTEKDVTFYKFKFSPVNTIDESFKDEWEKSFGEVQAKETIRTVRLDTILEELLEQGQYLPQIDFLSIDVEGHDFTVLKSINLTQFRPKLILIEIHGFQLRNHYDNEIVKYLAERNYAIVASNGYNIFFKSTI